MNLRFAEGGLNAPNDARDDYDPLFTEKLPRVANEARHRTRAAVSRGTSVGVSIFIDYSAWGSKYRQMLRLATLVLVTAVLAGPHAFGNVLGATNVDAGLSPDEHPAVALARRHENNFEFADARDAYESAIETIEASDGAFAAELIAPLYGLGRMQRRLDLNDAARASFRRGQHIEHRVRGVHAMGQLEAVRELIEIEIGEGEHMDADRQQRFRIYVAEHNYGADHPALVPLLSDLAQWYDETGQYARSRKAQRRIVDIVSANGSAVDADLIDPLLAIMKSRRLQSGTCCSKKETQQLAEILVTSRDLAPERKAEALLELGDNFTALGRPSRALGYYREAWALLTESERSAEFAEPRPVAMFRRLSSARLGLAFGTDPNRRNGRVIGGERLMTPRALEEMLRSEGQTDQDLQELEILPPQFFLVPLADHQYNTRIRDTMSTADGGPRTLSMVGEPVQFVRAQLKQVLPPRLKSDESLDRIAIELRFTVKADGQVGSVEIGQSNAPTRLNQMMRTVVRKTRYRPRVVDGEFVRAEGQRLRQTFNLEPNTSASPGERSAESSQAAIGQRYDAPR